MCDVVFITPNLKGRFEEESLGTLQLVTILEQQDMACEIFPYFRFGDVAEFDQFLSNAMEMIGQAQPKIVSMYTRCDTYHIVLKLAQAIKERWSDIYVVLGGPQSDTTSEETVTQIPWVDFVCCGEGENTVYPFFSSLLRGQPDLSVPGLVYRNGGMTVKNPRPALIEDLDTIPMIDYSRIQLSEDAEDMASIVFPIDVGRGCPFGCTYCSTKAFWGRKYRMKSPARIVDEIKAVHEQFGNTNFTFSHDMFTFNRRTVKETCELISKLDFPVHWSCSARLDCLDKETIDIMVQSGLRSIFIGVETGSKRMQKLINKNLKLDSAIELLQYLKEKGVKNTLSFIYGFPEETEEDLSQTMALIAQIYHNKLGQVDLHLCTFLAKTELSERYMSQMTRVEHYTDVTGYLAVDQCRDLIHDHPELFPHMMEYKTELRTKLEHFALFFVVWSRMQPVYQYLSERYPQDRLIDMYYDFLRVNQELLHEAEGILHTNYMVNHVISKDQFYKTLAQDENFDLVSDCVRMTVTENSQEICNGGKVSAVYCFDPAERAAVRPIQEYQRCVAVVTHEQNRIHTVKYPIRIG